MSEKESLIARVQEVTGVLPAGARIFLKALSHPDVVAHTKEYFSNFNEATMCLIYDGPWDCSQESEAKYESIYTGLMMDDTKFYEDWRENWCKNCKERVEIL